MSRHQIRVRTADDAERFVATDQTVWFSEGTSMTVEQHLIGIPPEHRFAAEVAGVDLETYAGVYGVFPMSLVVPGVGTDLSSIACAGLTWVGVHPDARRRGVLTAMVRDHLERTRDDGVAVSALHASEPVIYGRYGYGLASLDHEVTLGRGTTFTAPHLDPDIEALTTHLTTVSDKDAPERMERVHRAWAGHGSVLGALSYYERVCFQSPEGTRDKEPWRLLFVRRDGVDEGFAMFRRSHSWERARPSGAAEVWTVQGSVSARLALLRRLVDLDLVGSVKVYVGVDDPLFAWVGGPRATSGVETYDNLWVRLVDLPRALQARGWNAPCDVVVRVRDEHAPWNDGTWRIRAADGAAEVERSKADPDLSLDVAALGAAYLGGNLLGTVRAGLAEEHRPGAAAALALALATPFAPVGATGF